MPYFVQQSKVLQNWLGTAGKRFHLQTLYEPLDRPVLQLLWV